MNELRDCPYCQSGFEDPWEWTEHLYWTHYIGRDRPQTKILFEQMNWKEADAWYHASLLGVTP